MNRSLAQIAHKKTPLGKRQIRQARHGIEKATRFQFLLPGRIAEGKEAEVQVLETKLNQEMQTLMSKGYSRKKAQALATATNIILINRVLK